MSREEFYNKFEIPLTVQDTLGVFKNIANTGNEIIDSKVIKNVYMPVYKDDGTSGRAFLYGFDKQGYIDLIKKILEYKPIVITYPHGDAKVIKSYINYGVKDFMVSKWNSELNSLKYKFKDLKIFRSIVLNSYNENIDPNFDGIVVPYSKTLDIDWLKEKSKETELIGMINHTCNPNCKNIDKHISLELQNTDNKLFAGYQCPSEGKDAFIPRQVVMKISPYLSAFKLIDRLGSPLTYEKYISYYVDGIPLNQGNMDNANFKRRLQRDARVHELYESSNLVYANCQFRCNQCNKKCY